MKKIDIPSNLTTLAYDSIKQYILEGRLDENSRLTEEFLSDRLGISKSPIREALTRLESESLIRIEPRKGAYLKVLAREEIAELYDLREALEAHVVRRVRITLPLIDALRESIRRQRVLLKADDKASYIGEDVRFHTTLAQATGNVTLCSMATSVQNQIWLSRRKTYDLSSSTAPDLHENMVRAFTENDRSGAETIMREHIRIVRQRLLNYLGGGHAQDDTERAVML